MRLFLLAVLATCPLLADYATIFQDVPADKIFLVLNDTERYSLSLYWSAPPSGALTAGSMTISTFPGMERRNALVFQLPNTWPAPLPPISSARLEIDCSPGECQASTDRFGVWNLALRHLGLHYSNYGHPIFNLYERAGNIGEESGRGAFIINNGPGGAYIESATIHLDATRLLRWRTVSETYLAFGGVISAPEPAPILTLGALLLAPMIRRRCARG